MDSNFFLDLFKEVSPVAAKEDYAAICKTGGGIHHLEGLALYALSIKLNPEFIIEFSPNYGFSSICIALGLKRIGRPHSFATFECRKEVAGDFNKMVQQHKVQDFVEIVWGDALKEVPKFIRAKNLEGKTGLLFVDSCHSQDFGNKYVETIFPLLKKGCWVLVHDIGALSSDPKGKFKETLIQNDDNCGEYRAIEHYIQKFKVEYLLSHAIFGGSHEESAKLPVNDKMYQAIEEIIGCKIPRSICPKTIIFQTK